MAWSLSFVICLWSGTATVSPYLHSQEYYKPFPTHEHRYRSNPPPWLPMCEAWRCVTLHLPSSAVVNVGYFLSLTSGPSTASPTAAPTISSPITFNFGSKDENRESKATSTPTTINVQRSDCMHQHHWKVQNWSKAWGRESYRGAFFSVHPASSSLRPATLAACPPAR